MRGLVLGRYEDRIKGKKTKDVGGAPHSIRSLRMGGKGLLGQRTPKREKRPHLSAEVMERGVECWALGGGVVDRMLYTP